MPSLDDVEQERVRDALPHFESMRLLELLYPDHVEVLHRVGVATRPICDNDTVVLALGEEPGVLHGGQGAHDVFLELLA